MTDERLQEIRARLEAVQNWADGKASIEALVDFESQAIQDVIDLLAEVERLRAVSAALHRELVGQLEDEHSAEPWQAESYVVAIERKAQANEDEEPEPGLTRAQLDAAIKRATINSKSWARWYDPFKKEDHD